MDIRQPQAGDIIYALLPDFANKPTEPGLEPRLVLILARYRHADIKQPVLVVTPLRADVEQEVRTNSETTSFMQEMQGRRIPLREGSEAIVDTRIVAELPYNGRFFPELQEQAAPIIWDAVSRPLLDVIRNRAPGRDGRHKAALLEYVVSEEHRRAGVGENYLIARHDILARSNKPDGEPSP